MNKKSALLLALLLILNLLSGCGGGGGASARESITIIEGEWWGLDTTLLDGSNFAQQLVADSLVTLDADGNMLPGIASKVAVSEDGKTITLTIPEKLYYASGEEVMPEDVVASLERFKRVSPFATNLEPLASMEVSGRDVTLHLSEFTSDIAISLAGSFITVQDKDVLDASTDDDLLWGAKPYGAYYLEDYVPGSHVVLKRNPKYRTNNPHVTNKGPAHVETVTVRFMTEEFSMANAVNVDDAQVIMGISSDGISQITRKDIEVVQTISIPNIDYLEFNLSSPNLKDAKVREALAIAVDRSALVSINEGGVIEAWSIVTDKVVNHSADFAAYYKKNFGTNVERAKKLLEEAGWKDTDGNGYLDKDGQELKLKIVANDGATENKTVQSLQIQYKEIGVRLEIEMFSNYYHYEEIFSGNYDIGLEHFGWSEPILLLNMVLTDPQNLVNCGQEDVYFETIARASHTPDSAERTKLIDQVERILADHWITVPLYTGKSSFVFAGGVSGVSITGNGQIFFNDMK